MRRRVLIDGFDGDLALVPAYRSFAKPRPGVFDACVRWRPMRFEMVQPHVDNRGEMVTSAMMYVAGRHWFQSAISRRQT